MTDIEAFSVNRIGTTGHEILDPDGTVIAWAADEPWAHVIAALLNRVEAEGMSRQRNSACCRRGTDPARDG